MVSLKLLHILSYSD